MAYQLAELCEEDRAKPPPRQSQRIAGQRQRQQDPLRRAALRGAAAPGGGLPPSGKSEIGQRPLHPRGSDAFIKGVTPQPMAQSGGCCLPKMVSRRRGRAVKRR